MKIPVYKADFDNKVFSKITRLVSKTMNSEKISLSGAQEILSKVLGYASYHDLQQSVLQVDAIHFGTRDEINCAINLNARASFAHLSEAAISDLVQSWGLHRLQVFSSSPHSAIPGNVQNQIALSMHMHLRHQLHRRLSANNDLPDGFTVAQHLAKGLPPLFVYKDMAHEEMNQEFEAEYTCSHFELDDYRMLIKKGATEKEARLSMRLDPIKVDFLEAVSAAFDSALNVDIPAFLGRAENES